LCGIKNTIFNYYAKAGFPLDGKVQKFIKLKPESVVFVT